MKKSNMSIEQLRELLIGKKVKGFLFSETDWNYHYNPDMDDYIGKKATVGSITQASVAGYVARLNFEDGISWTYPVTLILEQLGTGQDSNNYEIY